MGKLKHIRYWLLGLLVMALCWGWRPAIAHLPIAAPGVPPTTIAQTQPSYEQQAQTAYAQGQYQAAIPLLEQAYQFHQQRGAWASAAIALSNLSLTHQQLGNWDAAAAALQRAWDALEQQPATITVQAQILDVQGQLQFAQGQLDEALASWQQAADLYTQAGNFHRQALSRLYQAQALQAKGLYQQVFRTLEDLYTDVSQQLDPATQAIILRQLGDSLRATGNLKEADGRLTESLNIAENLKIAAYPQRDSLMAATSLSYGNLKQSQFKRALEEQDIPEAITQAQAALRYYQQVAALDQGELGIQARLNFMRLLTTPTLGRWDLAADFYPTIAALLPQLPPGRATIYAYTGLAENLITLRQYSDRSDPSWREIADLLSSAQTQAQALGDERSQSLVLGTLGHLYEQTQQWDLAADLSRQALTLAQQAQADDIRYRWESQLGRILKNQDQEEGAIAAYSQAFDTLQDIRSDLLTANPDVQFSFRESIEPIYRDLVDLLLASVPEMTAAQTKADGTDAQARLQKAREVMEALQVAQLENFFQAACIDKTKSIDQVVSEKDPTAAVVYAILLEDRLEAVVKLPQQEDLVHFATTSTQQNVEDALRTYRTKLTRGANVVSEGRQLYDWLLRPAIDAGLISPDRIKTLIFVLDGDLRLIPMTTLHDGEDFLVRKYAISLVLGLDVRDPLPLPPRDQTQVLAASLENPPDDFNYSRLPGANEEISLIQATNMPVTVLKDGAFTQAALSRELQDTDFNIVHLATHGQFGRDRQQTFVLDANGEINIDTLGQLFQSRRQADTRLEILILSACKTATGDSREVLGIAGAMVQSGARSAIATLWSVDDEASVLFTQTLYQKLAQPGVSRAEALRLAQVALLDRFPNRPRYWAPYVLVGSWR